MVEAAGKAGVNILCLQEAWSMEIYFYFLMSQTLLTYFLPSNALRFLYERKTPVDTVL